MPRVPRAAGASQDLSLVVQGGRDTHFDVASKPRDIRVAIAPDDRPGAGKRYRMTVTVPPGLPAGLIDDPIVLKTDHPKVGELKIPVSIYISASSEGG
jgi:hypothetical protein